MPRTLDITDGPDKPKLLWAVAYPDREEVHFSTDSEALDVSIERMEELNDGLAFALRGVVWSGADSGAAFEATYSVANRSGTLTVLF